MAEFQRVNDGNFIADGISGAEASIWQNGH
jgi:hypothetical protein